MKRISDRRTRGVRITVAAYYIKEESSSRLGNYFFAYRVTIRNEGTEAVKLLRRKWIIINSDGDERIVEGEGVVGYQPSLKEEQVFTYVSTSALDTEWGSMEGHFVFIDQDGEEFIALIDRFVLTVEQSRELSKV
jgi:ApaG protein